MKRIVASILFRIDRLFPRTRVGGRESEQSYAAWEYESGHKLLENYAGYFGPLEGKAVLDIGCGYGGKTVVYAEAGARVVGVDIERRNISQCLEFAGARRREDIAFIVGDAGELPFADASFDVIVANDSMEHFPDPRGALLELARILRPGGTMLLFFTPWGSPLGSHLYDYIHTPWCHLLYTRKILESLLHVALEKRGGLDPGAEAARLMHEFDTTLNRITVARYHRFLKSVPVLETRFEKLEPAKFRFLAPLTRLPHVGELFTGTVVAVLGKRT